MSLPTVIRALRWIVRALTLSTDRSAPRLAWLVALAFLSVASPAVASAQRVVITITPASGNQSPGTLAVHVEWCAKFEWLDSNTRQILQNGTDITADFDYTVGNKAGCFDYATSDGTITLIDGVTNTIEATIMDQSEADAGYSSVDYALPPTYYVVVTPDTAAVTRAPNASSAETFAVHDTGTGGGTYTLAATCALPSIAACAAPYSVTLNTGETKHVTVTYTTGSGTGSGLTLTAAPLSAPSQEGSGTMSLTFTAATYGLTLTADSSAITRASRTDGAQSFTLHNTGNAITNYNLALTCPVALFTGCSAPNVVQVANGQTATVAVGYTTAVGAASGSLTLEATAQPDGTKNASASTSVSVQEPAFVTDATPPGWSTLERSQCLTIAIVPGVASQCDGLRIVHALPSVTTYGKARTPTLIYDREWIHGMGVSVNVTIPSTEAIPDTVLLAVYQRLADSTLVLKGTSRFPWGAAGFDRSTRRLARPWVQETSGVIRYRAEVQFKNGANPAVTKASVEGEDLEVFRHNAHFGAGWWLAGVEQLVFSQGWAGAPDDQVEWIGGDGSVRKYVRQSGSTTLYLSATPVDGPDTLIKNVNALSSDTAWVRHAGNNVRIYFDNSGQHTRTVNRLGQTTLLAWNGLSSLRLNSITVPGGLTYTFTYDASGWLDTVSVPGASGTRRTTFVREIVAGAATAGIRSIHDPDLSIVSYDYESWDSTAAIGGRTDRRGVHTTPNGEGWGPGLAFASTGLGGGQNVHHTLRNAGNVAMNPNALGTNVASAVGIDSVYTRYTDPRGNVTRFWVNPLGAPTKIINALGQTTLVRYTDSRFPGLATETVAPSGVVTRAWYNSRGLVDSTTTYNPYGDGRNATTKYAYDPKWDTDTSVTLPEGERTTKGLDPSTGNVLWAQSGGDTTRFHYAGTFLDSVATSDSAVDKYGYDALYNLAWHQRPNKHRELFTRDAIGRVIADTTYTKQWVTVATTAYDAAGRDSVQRSYAVRDSATGAAPTNWNADRLTVTTLYDGEDHPLSVTQSVDSGRALTPPYGNKLTSVTRWFTYDSIGRKTREWSGSDDITWHYDLAGNDTTGGRGIGGTRVYDALNRVIALRNTSDSATFTYDAVTGGLHTANNRYAHITRTYYPSGALKLDSASYANAALTAFDSAYVTTSTYDRDGRRTSLAMPSVVGGSLTYTYDPRTGQLATITDRNGMRYRYHYDLQGRPDTLIRRDGRSDHIIETRRYDIESNVTGDTIVGWSNEARGYDALNRLVSVNGTTVATYDALGHAVNAFHNNANQSFFYDAFGNRTERQSTGWGGTQGAVSWYFDGSNQPVFDVNTESVHADSTIYSYDTPGSLQSSTHNAWFGGCTCTLPDSAYIRDQRTNSYHGTVLFESDRWRDTVWIQSSRMHTPNPYQNWESYRYDALGRRVWQKMVYNSVCPYVDGPSGCTNSITRTVWDGSAILLEVRGDTNGSVSSGAGGGVVSYVHGLETDRPLAILKNGEHDVIPFVDWTNSFVWGGCPTTWCGDTDVVFPASVNNVFGAPIDQTLHPAHYYGSIINGMADGSGYVYQRNRYLDPSTGKFIQVDPLGLGGGLNVYGFGNGDPISYSDPFGLMGGCHDASGNKIDCPEPPGGPPVPLPNGKKGQPNVWVPVPGSAGGSRGTKWKPKYPIPSPTGAQPSGSWDKEGHWDVDDGAGDRTRYAPDGTEVDHDGHPKQPQQPASPGASESLQHISDAIANALDQLRKALGTIPPPPPIGPGTVPWFVP